MFEEVPHGGTDALEGFKNGPLQERGWHICRADRLWPVSGNGGDLACEEQWRVQLFSVKIDAP